MINLTGPEVCILISAYAQLQAENPNWIDAEEFGEDLMRLNEKIGKMFPKRNLILGGYERE